MSTSTGARRMFVYEIPEVWERLRSFMIQENIPFRILSETPRDNKSRVIFEVYGNDDGISVEQCALRLHIRTNNFVFPASFFASKQGEPK